MPPPTATTPSPPSSSTACSAPPFAVADLPSPIRLPSGLLVGLDGRNRFPGGGGTGVATYAATLAAALRGAGHHPRWLLSEHPVAPPRTRLPHLRRLLAAAAPRRRARPLPPDPLAPDDAWLSPDLFRVAHHHFALYRRPLPVRVPEPPALMHWTYPLPLRMPDVPELVTVHDLIPLERPDLSGIPPDRLDRLLRRLLPAAAQVVTVSETVRAALLRRYALSPERVVNTFQAVHLPPELLRAAAAIPDPPPAPPGCFLVLGSVEPRKNVARLLRAHARSRTARPLLLVGPDGAGAEAELAPLAGHPHPERVLRLPWLPRPTLVRLLRDARAVLFPSLAEGFGLPIAEAMTLGVPVLTSSGGATEEIAGGAALLADPLDEAALADAIARLDSDDALCAVLSAAGLDRAPLFAPAAYAARLDGLYRAVFSGAGGSPTGPALPAIPSIP